MRLVTLAALLVAAPAFAQTVPDDHRTDTKPAIPWKTVMFQTDGQPYVEYWDKPPYVNPVTGVMIDGQGKHLLTLAALVADALDNGLPSERVGQPGAVEGTPKALRGALAAQIRSSNPPATLTTEQAPVVKRLIEGLSPADVVYQAERVLFPDDLAKMDPKLIR